MVKTMGFVLLWLVGSAAAVAVAWAGVGVVDDEIISPAPAAIDRASGPVDGDGSTPDPSVTSPTTSPATAGSAGSARSSARSSTRSTSTTTRRTTTSRSAGTSSTIRSTTPTTRSTTPTTRPTSPTTRSTTPTAPTTAATTRTTVATTRTTVTAPTTTTTTTTTTATPPAGQTITFNLVGGSTAVSFAPGGVTILWATPNPGFDVEIGNGGPDRRVEFEADHHESRIDVWWSGGPRNEIRERDG